MRGNRLIIVLATLAGLSMPACAPLASDMPGGTPDVAQPKQSASPSQIKHGQYLTRAGDCASCHT
ncbi:MAG TPA: cytochrome c, partial [Burkholderiales bacterium]|nr:cytochrome c [Burkholderiales bacterium]